MNLENIPVKFVVRIRKQLCSRICVCLPFFKVVPVHEENYGHQLFLHWRVVNRTEFFRRAKRQQAQRK